MLDLADALVAEDGDRVGELMAASYAGARDLYEIGAPAMAAMIDAMTGGPGLIGARQAGAGFGGCMVAVVRRGVVEDFAAHVAQTYLAQTGVEPRTYPVDAAPGAGVLEDHP